MRNVVFNLLGQAHCNVPSVRNIQISTHYGSKLFVRPGIPTLLDVTDDPKTDGELLEWYKKRYSGIGLGIKLIKDPVIKQEPEKVVSEIKVEIEKPVDVSVPETPVAHVESKVDPDVMSYSELIQFAKDNNIQVDGRAKELYLKAIKRWLKAHD